MIAFIIFNDWAASARDVRDAKGVVADPSLLSAKTAEQSQDITEALPILSATPGSRVSVIYLWQLRPVER
jgi:hypothetical protein